MRRVVGGATVLIALSAASLAWAQNPSGGSAAPSASPAPAPASSAMPAAQHSQAMHAFHKRMSRRAGATGDTTAQLNRRELARIQAGNAGHPAPGPAMSGK